MARQVRYTYLGVHNADHSYSTTALVPLAPFPWAPRLSFTHGSLRPSFANLLPYPDAINKLGHSLLSKALTPPLAPPHPPHPYQGLPRGSTDSEMDLYAAGGPYWWRGLAEVADEATVCGWADELKKKLGVRRIIGGHTPDFEKIVHRCNASVIIIDTGVPSFSQSSCAETQAFRRHTAESSQLSRSCIRSLPSKKPILMKSHSCHRWLTSTFRL